MKTLILIAVLTSSIIAHSKEIKIGLIPGNGAEITKKAKEFAEQLEKRLNIKVGVYIPKDYQDLIRAMEEKKVDFAFFTAMSYIYAEKQANAKVLLKSVWEKPYYFSTIISRPGSNIKTLKDLKGKKIAFVDRKSTSGFLLPKLALNKAEINDYEVVFSGNHKKSIEKLMAKEVDAVAVFANDSVANEGAWSVYFPDKKYKPNNIWISQSLPTDPFTVRADFYKENPELSYDVMFALLDMPGKNKKKNILHDTLGISKMVTANNAQYDPIRELITKLNEIESRKADSM